MAIRLKKTNAYKERKDEARREFIDALSSISPSIVYYVDETGLDESYHRERGRSKRGEKVYGIISGRKYKRLNIVAAQCCGNLVAPMEYDGTTDHYVFEAWFKGELLEAIPRNSVVVLDNATFHRKTVLTELASNANARIMFLPAYSPDLNPVEKTWANLKSFLRKYIHRYINLQDAVSDYFKVE